MTDDAFNKAIQTPMPLGRTSTSAFVQNPNLENPPIQTGLHAEFLDAEISRNGQELNPIPETPTATVNESHIFQ